MDTILESILRVGDVASLATYVPWDESHGFVVATESGEEESLFVARLGASVILIQPNGGDGREHLDWHGHESDELAAACVAEKLQTLQVNINLLNVMRAAQSAPLLSVTVV